MSLQALEWHDIDQHCELGTLSQSLSLTHTPIRSATQEHNTDTQEDINSISWHALHVNSARLNKHARKSFLAEVNKSQRERKSKGDRAKRKKKKEKVKVFV